MDIRKFSILVLAYLSFELLSFGQEKGALGDIR